MDNPVGGITRGWDDIQTVYERIFSGAADFWFECHDSSYHDAGEIFYVVGRERGEYRSGDTTLQMAIRTTVPAYRWGVAPGTSPWFHRRSASALRLTSVP